MTSAGDGSAQPPIDPDFAGLFRPEDLAPAPEPVVTPDLEPVASSESVPAPEPIAAPAAAEEPPSAPEPPPVPAADPVVDTGRLFRSQGATGHDEAVLALSSDHFGRLKTLQRSQDEAPAPAVDDDGADPAVAALLGTETAAATDGKRSRSRRRAPSSPGSRRSISAGAVYVVVIGATLIAAFLNALLADGDIGWPTGLVLVISSVYAALTVRREDDSVAIIVPPLAFLLAALTAGQLFLGSADSSILNRAVVVFFTLADNWVWIIGATVAALVIVLVRRRRS